MAAGILEQKLDHMGVMDVAKKVGRVFVQLVSDIIAGWEF
jgi:purine nucleoside phosphorylase